MAINRGKNRLYLLRKFSFSVQVPLGDESNFSINAAALQFYCPAGIILKEKKKTGFVCRNLNVAEFDVVVKLLAGQAGGRLDGGFMVKAVDAGANVNMPFSKECW